MPIAFTEMNAVLGTDGADEIILTGGTTTGVQNVQAGEGDDLVKLNGVSGLANGEEDNDTLIGNHGRDTLLGGEGDDLLRGEGGSDIMMGGEGDDVAYGGADNDRIFGGAGEDTIIGGNEDDVLSGDDRANADVADVFVFDNEDGNDRILDFDSLDSIELIGDGSEAYTITTSGSNAILTYGSTTVTLLGAAAELDASDITYVDASTYDFL